MLNNPVNFNDPTGHKTCNEEGYCFENGAKVRNRAFDPLDRMPKEAKNSGSSTDGIASPLPAGPACTINSCFGSASTPTYWWEDPTKLDNIANTLQDLATLASSTGALVTITSTISGCIVGSEAGVLPGCAAGYAGGFLFHNYVTNPPETALSISSLLVTAWSDYQTGDLTYQKNKLIIGEDTLTSLSTVSVGLTTSEPLTDAAIDIYASGYNHGYFCGISTFISCLIGQ